MAGTGRGRLAAAAGEAPRPPLARRGRPAADRGRPVNTGAIVGIDTSTRSTSVAVLAGREVERRDDPAPHESPRHAERLQPLLEQALEQAEVTWDDVTR